MTVKRLTKKGKYGVPYCELTCDECGKVSEPYCGRSPAAPELTACEEAKKKDGWSFSTDFFAMIGLFTNYCKECQQKFEKRGTR